MSDHPILSSEKQDPSIPLPTSTPTSVQPRPFNRKLNIVLFTTGFLLFAHSTRGLFSQFAYLDNGQGREVNWLSVNGGLESGVGGYWTGLKAKGVGLSEGVRAVGMVMKNIPTSQDEEENDEEKSEGSMHHKLKHYREHKEGKHSKHSKHWKHHHGDQSKHGHDHHGKHGKHGHHGHGKHGHHGPHPPFKHISAQQAEEIFLKVPSNDSVAAASKRYTSYEHMAGTGNDHLSALYLKSEYEELLGLPVSGPLENVFDAGSEESQSATRGLVETDEARVWIDTYYPIMNKPVGRKVEILSDGPSPRAVEWAATLREDIVAGDPTSIYRDEVPVFHGLSISGDVTGKIVYVGYGRKRDFEALEAAGVDVKGSIALVKYGGVFRGLKIKAAQEAGAVGCLIFTDPGDDGEITVKNGYEMYPDGPARQESSVQRGSVQFISSYPGDPATPGTPAYPNATRSELANIPSIPSLPISYLDALPLLKTLIGQGKPAGELSPDWIGGLEGEPHGLDSYWTGPGTKDVHFVNEVDTKVTPIWNTMAVIPGHIKDEVVVIGNHRDAWVLGGADPSSGTATTYEIMRGFSKLMKKGWKPLRTILVASWDAEEYGLIGSTEWCEDFGDWLQKHAVSYLNLDVSVAGTNFHGSASPSLALLLKSTAEQIEHPTDEARSLWSMKDGGDWKEFNVLQDEVDFEELFASGTGIGALGSGSDYTAFLQRFGVASTDMGYGGGPRDPPYHYHSIYDSHTWQKTYADPGFHKHAAAAQMLGLMTLRVADSLVLPLNITQYTLDLSGYLAKVKHIADLDDSTSSLNFTSLSNSINNVQLAAQQLDDKTHAALKKLKELVPKRWEDGHGRRISLRRVWRKIRTLVFGGGKGHEGRKMKEIKKVLKEIREINGKLSGFESGFLSEQGIKDREWYKHKGTAPGKWLGYGATTFPALTEALTIDKSPELAQKEADELAGMIEAMVKRLRG